jgi:hypothetical protein
MTQSQQQTAPKAFDHTRGIKAVSYTHEAMIDLILTEPTVTAVELGQVFNYSAGWVSRVIASDAFQARLAERKAQLIDPMVAASLDERLRGVAIHSMSIIQDKLANSSEESAQFAMDALGLATVAMGQQKRSGAAG